MQPYTMLDRAGMALRHMLSNALPDHDWLVRFDVNLLPEPKWNPTGWDYGDVPGRYAEALPLAWTVSGQRQGEDVLRGILNAFLSRQREDGLFYRPELVGGRAMATVPGQSRTMERHPPEVVVGEASSILRGLLGGYQALGETKYLQAAERCVEALDRLAEPAPRGRCYPGTRWTGEDWADAPNSDAVPPYYSMCGEGFSIYELVQLAEATGREQPLALADDFALSCQDGGLFGPDGSFRGHSHARTHSALGFIKLARATGRTDLLDEGKQALNWFLTQSSRHGFFPEVAGAEGEHRFHAEWSEVGCISMDVLESLALLSESDHRYLDVIERIARNILQKAQIVPEYVEQMGLGRFDPSVPADRMNLADVAIGAWNGIAYPNDLLDDSYASDAPRGRPYFVPSGCCSPSGMKALYVYWRKALDEEGDRATVNLLADRSGDRVDVRALPGCEGVDVFARMEVGSLRVHVPDWASKVEASVDGKPCSARTSAGFVDCGPLAKGTTVRICFAPEVVTCAETIGGRSYDVSWRGYDVAGIWPAGGIIPLWPAATRA